MIINASGGLSEITAYIKSYFSSLSSILIVVAGFILALGAGITIYKFVKQDPSKDKYLLCFAVGIIFYIYFIAR